ncbi:MAG: terpene cyclase/mutase family protein, partial [Clostridia bacterium]|nr:terpene cyclase/mutase family protein [Clostridia bacterium]
MSWVYGLHLIHNGFESNLHTENEIIEKLLALQLADGGWALSGNVGNADVTAMTVQALAPHKENELINASLERAITHLVNLQEDDGGYKSYGVLNPETTSQVIVALTSMGIDPFSDARFIKNGKTLLDALSLFVLEDGSFSHTLSGASSPMATAQAFYSLVSYKRLLDGKSSLYEFDKTDAFSTPLYASSVPSYKWIASGAVLVFAIILSIVFLFLKKRNFKNYLFILVIALILITFVFLSDFKSPDDFYSTTAVQKNNIIGSVNLEIRCDTISGEESPKHVPKDGTILKETAFPLS